MKGKGLEVMQEGNFMKTDFITLFSKSASDNVMAENGLKKDNLVSIIWSFGYGDKGDQERHSVGFQSDRQSLNYGCRKYGWMLLMVFYRLQPAGYIPSTL